MAAMTMNRVIHGAVRRDLDRLAAALRTAADAGTADADRTRALEAAYAQLHRQLVHHHEQEDALIFPALSRLGVDRFLIDEMEQEHQAMSEALARTSAAMTAYAGSGSAADADTARASVEQTRLVVDRHLAHEEAELEPLLVQHAESAEWKAVERQLHRQPPATAGTFFAWVTDGMGPEEERYVRSTVPAPVVAVLSRVFGRSYHRRIAPVWRLSPRAPRAHPGPGAAPGPPGWV